jgi:hypothetical protein
MYKKMKSRRRQIRKVDVTLSNKVSTSSAGLKFVTHRGSYAMK